MEPYNTIKSGISYIEQNLKTDITVDELANMAGYSVRHYRRLFMKATGMTVAAFIEKRRLDRALGEIAGCRRAVDAALDYCFDTYAGFYKAFVRMYGNSPKKFLSKAEVITLYTEKELRDILLNWDIPQDLPIIDIYIMDGSKVSGSVWSVGEDYILKTGDRNMMLRNLQITKALAAQGFAASEAIPAKSGADYIGDEKITVLTRGIKGSPLTKSDKFGEKRREFGKKYGENIARLHKALIQLEGEIKPHERNLYKQVTEWAMPEVKKQNYQYQMGLDDSFFEDYTANFGTIFEKLPKQLAHCDPNPSNILFENGEVSGFIDFDLSERNIRLWDICYCVTGILSEWRGVDGIHEKWPDILESIISGYNSVNKLTDEEKQAVYYVICSIQMICAAYFESVNEYKELAKTNREMLQYIAKNKNRIINIIK